jgi:hypothetical protein
VPRPAGEKRVRSTPTALQTGRPRPHRRRAAGPHPPEPARAAPAVRLHAVDKSPQAGRRRGRFEALHGVHVTPVGRAHELGICSRGRKFPRAAEASRGGVDQGAMLLAVLCSAVGTRTGPGEAPSGTLSCFDRFLIHSQIFLCDRPGLEMRLGKMLPTA